MVGGESIGLSEVPSAEGEGELQESSSFLFLHIHELFQIFVTVYEK